MYGIKSGSLISSSCQHWRLDKLIWTTVWRSGGGGERGEEENVILGLGWRRFSAGVRVNERVESKHRLFNILSVLCYQSLRSIGKGGWNYIQSQWDPCIINIVDWIKTCLINKLSPVILAIHVVGLRFYINSKNQLLKIYKLMIITDDITAIWLRCVIFQEDIQDKRWRHKCSRLFPLLLFKTLWLITYIFFNWNYLYIHFIRFHGKPNYLILLIMQNEKGVLYL